MKYRNLFDCLENAEDSTMEKITENAPELGNEQLERILDMSERKYNTKKRERINTEYTDGYGSEAVAEGVEAYNRPAWMKFAATAAALVLTAGLLALSHNLLKRGRSGPDVPSEIYATSSVTTTGTTDAENTELTTVIADTDSTETGTAAADNATTVTEAAIVTSSPAQQTSVSGDSNNTANNEDEMNQYKQIAENLFDSYAYCRDYLLGDGLKVSSSDPLTFRYDWFDWENEDYDSNSGRYYVSPIEPYHKVADPAFPDFQAVEDYINNIMVLPLESGWCFADNIGGEALSSAEYPDNAIISSDEFGKRGHFIIYDGELYASDGRYGGGPIVYTGAPEIVKISDNRFKAYREYHTALNPDFTDKIELVIERDTDSDRWRIVAEEMSVSSRG